MKFKLSAYTIHEQGPRARQEDSLFPAHNDTKPGDRLFIVCDGMGGHSAGDVASSTVCAAMSDYILTHVPDAEGPFSDDLFQAALAAAYDALDTKDDGSPKKMGTTLTFLKLHKDGYMIAHIGDSRVYHIRPGADAASTQILLQTQDHSLVNDLVRIGEMTPEEAKTSKQRNVITRAMQPNLERRSRATIAHGNDICRGDYFMLCSDGILEQMEDDNLKFIFSDEGGDTERKVDMLINVTSDNRDNHTAIIVRIDDVELEEGDCIVPYVKPEEKVEKDGVEEPHGDDAHEQGEDNAGILDVIRPYLVPTLIVASIVAVGLIIYHALSKPEDNVPHDTEVIADTPDSEVNGTNTGDYDESRFDDLEKKLHTRDSDGMEKSDESVENEELSGASESGATEESEDVHQGQTPAATEVAPEDGNVNKSEENTEETTEETISETSAGDGPQDAAPDTAADESKVDDKDAVEDPDDANLEIVNVVNKL